MFGLADQLAEEVYLVTRAMPVEQRAGLQSQLRQAAVSVPSKIIEGCARRSVDEYVECLSEALGFAAQLRYLLGLAVRLEMLEAGGAAELDPRCSELIRSLQALIDSSPRA